MLNSMSRKVQQTSAEQLVQRSAVPEQSSMAAGQASHWRSRSSSLHTPRTPSDAGHVSDEENLLNYHFDCNVIMNSGESLRSFRCDELTSIGYIRKSVLQFLTVKHNAGELQEFDSFRLLRGERICRNDYTKVYELFPNFESEYCFLTVVLLTGSSTSNAVL